MELNPNPVYIKGRIVANNALNGNYYQMTIDAPEIAKKAKPGQFVMVSTWHIRNLLLKRPFSFFEIDAERGLFKILYKEVGKGTQILTQSRPNETIELIGPLGNGFTIAKDLHTVAIVARGIGVAALMPLILECARKNIKIYSFLSATEKKYLIADEEIESISLHSYFTTDDGSKGVRGNVTLFLAEILNNADSKIDSVFTCGSKRLARHIKTLQGEYHFPAFVSLEERMGCGIGACKGCVINTISGYQRVCKEGPVFPLEVVLFNE